MQWIASNQPHGQRMLEVVRAGLERAVRADIGVAFLRFSGLHLLVDDIRRFRQRGRELRVLTSTYQCHTQPEAVRALTELIAPANVKVFDNDGRGFHMKAFLFHGQPSDCWIGSSNLTKGGLTSNYELNLLQQEPVAFAEAQGEFEAAWNDCCSYPLSEELYRDYRRRYLASNGPTNQQPLLVAEPGPGRQPNEAQREALQRLHELRRAGEKKAVVIAAPGIGKTFLAAFDCHAARASNILFISHRLEHLRQALYTFLEVMPNLDAGLAPASDWQSRPFVCATIQALKGHSAVVEREWDYVVIDEFHHAEAKSYRNLLGSLSTRFLLGLTATPERADGHDVLRICDYNVAYEIRLPEAINRKWLLPFHYFAVNDDVVDYNAVPWRRESFDPAAQENALSVEPRVELALKHALEKGFDGPRRATVGFCAGRKHARFMAEAFRQRGLEAECVTGDIPVEHRERIYADFANAAHPLEWLFVSDVLNEGVDIPAINSLLFLRPTDSATIFIQQLGRGLRLHPDCQVLTVIDLVGSAEAAWTSLRSLHDDRDAGRQPVIERAGVQLTPPRDCEFLLDERTQEILQKVERKGSQRKEACRAAYERLKLEIGYPPYPVDLLGRADMPEMTAYRSVFEDWIGCRQAMGDAEEWERQLVPNHPLRKLLARCERDWQAQRVHPYALLWGAVKRPGNLEAGYAAFFERFPRWSVEQAALPSTRARATLSRELESLWDGDRLPPEVLEPLPQSLLLEQVESRLQYVLERDFITRHGGVLRQPGDLRLWTRYSRSEIVNHFGRQYDPTVHNQGILTFKPEHPDHLAIIAKLDTSTAKASHRYVNGFPDSRHFQWQSQNKNTPETEPGYRLVTPGAAFIHLFVQERAHARPVYCGLVRPVQHRSSKPIEVIFQLASPVPETLL